MASTTSYVSESWNYDVFMCFRGKDTRKTFVDHLYSALVQQGIRTYLFDQTLPRGKAIGPSISTAIEESRIALVVLSENFANSVFCLNELSLIMDCRERGQIVFPIFYQVEPSDVREQRGSFGESFSRNKMQSMNGEYWGKALTDVANLFGWVIGEFNGDEVKQIQKIVDTISIDILSRNKDRFEMGTHLKIPSQDMLLPSSSSSSSQSGNHDVFVSFRGQDTRSTFVDHLYLALVQQGINTYMYEEILHRDGAFYSSSQLKAIEESRIALIVFSKTYANSPWCLDELAYIAKCSNERDQIVIPIFYHLEPGEVQKQVREALAKHELEKKNVESRGQALDVVDLFGFIANDG